MSRARNKKNLALRGVVIVLVAVFLISTVFFCLGMWERSHSTYSKPDMERETKTFEGAEYVLKDGIESFLILGLDKYEGSLGSESYNNDQQADFLMLFVFDNNEKTFKALHINRDTMTGVNVLGVAGQTIGKETCQIALSHTYGNGKDVSCRNAADAVSELLLGAKVNHYLSLKLDAVPKLNDVLGGVEVEILDDFSGIDDHLVKGEKVLLKGDQALTYVRTRKGLEDSSNFSRMKRQRQYIDAMYQTWQAKAKAETDFSASALIEISEYLCSDRSVTQLQDLTDKFETYEFLGIESLTGQQKEGEKFLEFYPDADSVQKNVIDLFYKEK